MFIAIQRCSNLGLYLHVYLKMKKSLKCGPSCEANYLILKTSSLYLNVLYTITEHLGNVTTPL
jgi:hypothetical protein